MANSFYSIRYHAKRKTYYSNDAISSAWDLMRAVTNAARVDTTDDGKPVTVMHAPGYKTYVFKRVNFHSVHGPLYSLRKYDVTPSKYSRMF